MFVRNSDGMMMTRLVDGLKAAGALYFGLESGSLREVFYYLVFHAGRYVEVKKLILLDR